MKIYRATVALTVVLAARVLVAPGAENDAGEVRRLIERTNLPGGVIVHVGRGDGRFTAALRRNEAFVVQGLDTDLARIAQAREYVRGKGTYGAVSIRHWDGRRLPYADNLINLIVVEDGVEVPRAELRRALAPNGVAFVRAGESWEKVVKPWPEAIDEWTHYLHGADGNPVARDRVVGPPKHYQWVSEPMWMRSHESDSSVRALVTAGGRLFYIVDEAPISLVGPNSPPDKWFLTARDAFNGVRLWKVPIEDWGWRAWKPSWFTPRPGDIPLNIQKRLVATEDRVYVTLGYHAPVSEIDARTGEILRRFEGTDNTAEILLHDGSLVLTAIEDDRARVMVVDADGGQTCWRGQKSYGGTTTDYYRFRAMRGSVPPAKVDPTLNTATDGKVVALLDGEDVVCLDFQTGREKWRSTFPLVAADHKAGNINAVHRLWRGTLIVQDGVVLHASPNQLAAFSAETGRIVWTQPKKYLQHLWFEWMDVFVIDGLVWTWSAELDRGPLEGAKQRSTWPTSVNGYDLYTGRAVKRIPLGNIFKTHHHHRCYRNKATSRYILASRRGSEYVDLETGGHTVHNWVRGTCHLGMMPANGLQYAPPHPCVCYIDEKINGLTALAPARPGSQAPRAQRFRKGPAFGRGAGPAVERQDWPTFRGNGLRSGSVATEAPSQSGPLWRRKVGRKLAAPIAVGERLFVPLADEHAILAVGASDGEDLWRYTVGGRIDSPPTYHDGMLLFGSADGWVYCVRADDGQLAWRFRAAPEERFIAAFGQLESAWPVHGSVLVTDAVAYFAAGRSSHLDGGLYLFGLDATTGQVRYERKLEGPFYDVNNIRQNYGLPMGALPDILQSDGRSIRMRETLFDAALREQGAARASRVSWLYSKAGMLDDSYFKRTPWTLGLKGDYARLIVHDENTAYFVRMFDSLQGLNPNVYFTAGDKGYLLFALDKAGGRELWKHRIPIRVNAMAVTKKHLFVAGPPDMVDDKDPLGAFEDRKGGVLCVFDKAGGGKRSQTVLCSAPVFNGMAVARGRLFVTMRDGSVAAFGR
jgi:outer membrane protein assembly factor BamB